MNKYIKLTALAFAASLAFAATSAHATNGVLEINQACAAVGCFAGDSAGFPVTINTAGSYRLTSNLNAGDSSVNVVQVGTNNVNLDLNGFGITGGRIGIVASRENFTVENGRIYANSDNGISSLVSTGRAVLRDLEVSFNRGHGIEISNGMGHISNVTVLKNTLNGVEASSSTVVRDSYIYDNNAKGQVGGICMNSVYRNNGSTAADQTSCLRRSGSTSCSYGSSFVTCPVSP